MPVLITVGLFLLFCFLWGVGSLFGSTKDAAQRWSGRRNMPSRAQKATAVGIEKSFGTGIASTAQPAPFVKTVLSIRKSLICVR